MIGLLGRRAPDVEVERRHLALDVDVPDDEVVALDLHVLRALGEELLEHVRGEAVLRQADAAELLRVHQAAGAVVAEDHVVLRHDLLAAHVLDRGEAVADHLEDDVGVLEREAGHDEAALAGRAHEAVGRRAEVAEDLAEALGLALLGAAEHGEQLRDRLRRHDPVQEQDRVAHALEVDVEVGAGEAEEDRDVRDREHDGVHQHAERGVAEGDRERQRPAVAAQAADDVGAAHLVEHRADHLDLAQRPLLAEALER